VKKPSGDGPRPATLILLAGGPSFRMKRDKALLPVAGEPLVQRILSQVQGLFDEILVSVAKGRRYDFLQYSQVEDEVDGLGPLAGILSGLRAARNPVSFVMACDVPRLDRDFVSRMLDAAEDFDIAVPRTDKGLEPLLAVYKKTAIPHIERLLASSERRVLALFDRCRTRVVDIGRPPWLLNLNTPGDYRKYLRSLKKGDRHLVF
jgi:molybdopterin-guanine dinucleotide biosynthesis protein A